MAILMAILLAMGTGTYGRGEVIPRYGLRPQRPVVVRGTAPTSPIIVTHQR